MKWHPDLDALAAVFGCFGAVFERSSTSCSRLMNVVQYLFLTRYREMIMIGHDESVTALVLVTRESAATIWN